MSEYEGKYDPRLLKRLRLAEALADACLAEMRAHTRLGVMLEDVSEAAAYRAAKEDYDE